MSAAPTVFVARDMEAPEWLAFGGGRVAVFSRAKPGAATPNEDAAGVKETGERRGVLLLADGAGGGAAGGRASEAAIRALLRQLEEPLAVREGILAGFERAHAAVQALGVGAATTLLAVEIDGTTLRSYHTGDSFLLVVGQRGRRRLQNVAHSPVGYAVEAGVLDEQEALHHEDRHLVSNLIGAATMHVEMTSALELAPRDTVVLASDGLSDNLHVEEIVEIVRKGPLERAGATLAQAARTRMEQPREGAPSKPDDLTFLIYRPRAGRAGV